MDLDTQEDERKHHCHPTLSRKKGFLTQKLFELVIIFCVQILLLIVLLCFVAACREQTKNKNDI